jgi:hypothetical protein
MSAFTIATLAVLVVVVLGLVVVLADEYSARFGPVEIHTISTRDLPNVAADLDTTATGTADTGRART